MSSKCCFVGAFRLYDLDNNGTITRDEMLQIVKAIFSMVGNHAQFKDDDNTPEKRVDRIFALMDTVRPPLLTRIRGIAVHYLQMRFAATFETTLLLISLFRMAMANYRRTSFWKGPSKINPLYKLSPFTTDSSNCSASVIQSLTYTHLHIYYDNNYHLNGNSDTC